MPIASNKVLAAWDEFLRGGIEGYERAAREFQEKQPELWCALRQLDDEWFSGKTDHVAAHGVFVWRMMTAEYGAIGSVSKELLEELNPRNNEMAVRWLMVGIRAMGARA